MSSGSVTFLFHPTRPRLEALRSLAAHGQIPVAELLRRLIDHGTSSEALNTVLPARSGSDWDGVLRV